MNGITQIYYSISIISRDTAIRYDYALRVANILNVPVGSLCGDIPYEEGTTEPGLLSNFGGLATELNKKTYFSITYSPNWNLVIVYFK